ncbi:hypothetical protein BS47DRAFT_1365783 [Hydnum rufescens UP504]|uniref:Uncharacterized protein n=1 Tax=Hydnum rufescens UP504 TaxID=1448309 RepID=A0A9P6DP66_9AGAM|nr:hypothetical protein BS47DRAFT_1365783 [Hydnum rufescens UP504]
MSKVIRFGSSATHEHVYRWGKKDIRVNIWPTDGPYDEILHILARLAHNVYGSSVTQPLLDETFGLLQLSAHSIALYIPPQCGFRVTRKTTTTLFSVPFHLEWRVSEHKFLVSPLALTPQRSVASGDFYLWQQSSPVWLHHKAQYRPQIQPRRRNPFRPPASLVGAMPPALTPPEHPQLDLWSRSITEASSSACTPVADFDSNDEDFGTPFEHELEDGQASVTQGDDGLDATGDSFLDSINASSVPAYHGPKSCDTDVRNQREVSPLVSWTSNPLRIIITPRPDSPDTPILDITDGTHDDFLLSDGDSDNAVPLKLCPPNLSSHLSEEPSSDEDDEDLKGGPFTTPEVEKIKAEYTVFDKQIAGLVREMGHSVNSIQKIAILPTLTIHPAYDELIKKYGGEKSEDWAAESARLVKEYTETRAAISADIAKHGGEVAKIIASHKRAWQKDFRALASFGIMPALPLLMLRMGSYLGLQRWNRTTSPGVTSSLTLDVYTFILSAKAGVRKAEEHKAQTLRCEREEAFKNPNKAKGKVSKMLIQLFEPFICWTTFPWLKLPQKLLSHNLVINGVLPLSRFRLFGSLSIDHYSVSEIQAMYNALENGQLKVSECTHEESNSGETALITDSGGQVLMTVASALEMIGAKKKLDSKRAAANLDIKIWTS